MAHIVYISVGMTSTLSSSFELARRLVQAGHRVTFVSHADVGAQVDAAGYPWQRLTADAELAARFETEVGAPRASAAWLQVAMRLRKASIDNDEIERRVRALGADLLIIDLEMHFAMIATAALNIPTVVAGFFFSIYRRGVVPPLHYDLVPGESIADRLKVDAAWARTVAGARSTVWKRRLDPRRLADRFGVVRYTTMDTDDLRAVAQARGFDLAHETDATHWLRPYVYTRLPVLCLNVREADFPHVPPANVHYVGPMINRLRVGPTMDPEARAQLDRRLKKPEPRRPLVYCSLGSLFAVDTSFMRRVIEVFVHRPDWDLVIGLGRRGTREALGPVPDNVLALEWAPQIEILQVADCAIVHGGVSSLNECLYFGVPMVVYSTKHVDQNGNSARVRYHRAGVTGDKDSDDARAIEQNIERALTDETIHAGVARLRNHVLRYEEEQRAERLIEKILDRGVRSL